MTIEIKHEAMHLRHVFDNERCFSRGSSALKKKTTLIKFTKKEEKLINYLMKSGHIDLTLQGKPLESVNNSWKEGERSDNDPGKSRRRPPEFDDRPRSSHENIGDCGRC